MNDGIDVGKELKETQDGKRSATPDHHDVLLGIDTEVWSHEQGIFDHLYCSYGGEINRDRLL